MGSSLAIVIVNWNSYEVTRNCLDSLRSLNHPDYEVVLVDNGSEDGSGDRLKQEFPEITLLKNEQNLGFTGGNNRGINYALESDKALVMLLNNDTIVTPDFASILCDRLMAEEDLGAIQPKIMFNQERHIIWNGGTSFSKLGQIPQTLGFRKEDQGQFDKAHDIPWVTGCCFLIKAAVVKQIGTLDDRFFIYYEDTDWSFRVAKADYRMLYEPSTLIYHEVGRSEDNRESFGEGNLSPFAHYITVRNHIFFTRKHARGFYVLTAWAYQLAKIFAYMLYFLLKRRFRKLNASWKGFREGLSTKLS